MKAKNSNRDENTGQPAQKLMQEYFDENQVELEKARDKLKAKRAKVDEKIKRFQKQSLQVGDKVRVKLANFQSTVRKELKAKNSKQIIVRETGSITGSIEADRIEIHGHLDGKVSAQNIVVGATGTVKGDIEFGNNLRTENGADIDGYIKKTNSSKSKLTGDFLFKKKDKKEPSEAEDRPDVVNKEAIA